MLDVMSITTWSALAAAGFPFPEGAAAADLAAELSEMLASPDPVVRDEHAYNALAEWTAAGHLDSVLTDLGDTAAQRFAHPQVQARAFAPLVLTCVLERVEAAPGSLPDGAAERWYEAFAAWYPAERDTRGWDDEMGWLHTVAHGADAAATFAMALPGQGAELLELCARRMTATDADYRYLQKENARLARAVTRILNSPGLTLEEATGWLAIPGHALARGGPGALPIWAFNTFATLESLHFHLARGMADGGVPPHATAVSDQVAALLRLAYPWLA
jgi:hypothetical protein